MKNQIFNIKRFALYANYNLRMHGKMYLLHTLGMGIGIFLFTLFNMLTSYKWNGNNWFVVILFTSITFSLIFVGISFPELRKKNGPMAFFLLPASTFEKFAFEFILRFVIFILIYLVNLIAFTNLAYFALEFIRSFSDLGMENYQRIFEESIFVGMKAKSENIIAAILVFLFALSLMFAGTTTFLKYAFIKTIVFVLAIVGSVSLYFYLIFEKLKLDAPFFIHIFKEKDKALLFLNGLVIFSLLWVFIYAFYKLEEKEV